MQVVVETLSNLMHKNPAFQERFMASPGNLDMQEEYHFEYKFFRHVFIIPSWNHPHDFFFYRMLESKLCF